MVTTIELASIEMVSFDVEGYSDFSNDLENMQWMAGFEETSNASAALETAPEDFEQLYKWFIS